MDKFEKGLRAPEQVTAPSLGRIIRPAPGPILLEQRFVFDGAAAVDIADNVAEPSAEQPSAAATRAGDVSQLLPETLLKVSTPMANEGSDYAVVQVSGPAGVSVSLALLEQAGLGHADIDEAQVLEVWNGESWVAQAQNSSVTIRDDGLLLVRINIAAEQDNQYEGYETFELSVWVQGDSAPTLAAITVVDDGGGLVFPDVSPDREGMPQVIAGTDDDRQIVGLKPDQQVVEEDTVLLGNVLDNDQNADEAGVSVVGIRIDGTDYLPGDLIELEGGSIIFGSDGSYDFKPTPDWFGQLPTITYTTSAGERSSLDITVVSVNDPAIISLEGRHGEVREDTDLTVGGQLLVSDRDSDASFKERVTAGVYGTFEVDAMGAWTYRLNNDASVVQRLSGSDSYIESFTVVSADGTKANIVIVVNGLDEPWMPSPVMAQPVVSTFVPQSLFDSNSGSGSWTSTAQSLDGVGGVASTASSNGAMSRALLDFNALQSATPSDLQTWQGGFSVVVFQGGDAQLAVYRGVADQYAGPQSYSSFTIPYDAFAHTDPNEWVLLDATQADGRPLPPWISFDPQTGRFDFQAPSGFVGELKIKLIARDSQGREASTLFRLIVGERQQPMTGGRIGLTDQLRQAVEHPTMVSDSVKMPTEAKDG